MTQHVGRTWAGVSVLLTTQLSTQLSLLSLTSHTLPWYIVQIQSSVDQLERLVRKPGGLVVLLDRAVQASISGLGGCVSMLWCM
jgi:hypothetical protein